MVYAIYTTPSGHRSLQKLPQTVKKQLLKVISRLSHQPQLGEQLEGELKFLHSLHCKLGRVHYRVAYEVDESHQEIVIHYANTRENFYKKLKQLHLKPLTSAHS